MTPNDFLQILVDAKKKNRDEVPSGWYSRKQLEGLWDVEKTAICDRLAKGVKLGVIEVKPFRIQTECGVIRKIPHYFFKDEKKSRKSKN